MSPTFLIPDRDEESQKYGSGGVGWGGGERVKKYLLCDTFDLDSGAEWHCGHSSRVWVDYTPISPTATSQG